jgi:sugar-specific transcriptional regulator TrmB
MAELLSAEKVMEREKERFQERYERAQKEADEAKAQVEKLEQALRVLNDGSSPTKGE